MESINFEDIEWIETPTDIVKKTIEEYNRLVNPIGLGTASKTDCSPKEGGFRIVC